MIDDIRLPERWSKGSNGGPAFLTDVVRMVSGELDREERWEHPLSQFDIAHNAKRPEDIAELRRFHRARRGASRGFLLKDWIEFTSAENGVGVPTAVDQPLGTGDGIETVFSVVKRYSDVAASYDAPIFWPVAGTMLVAVDGAATTSFTVQRGAGTVTFDVPPGNGSALTCGFEFDVPVHFVEDLLSISWDTINSRSAGSVPLEELRGENS